MALPSHISTKYQQTTKAKQLIPSLPNLSKMDHLLHLDTDVVCLLAKLNSYDYIMVGSSFGGGPLAETLAAKNKKVLLIERGGVIFSTHVLNISRLYYSRGASKSPEGNERVYDAVKAKVQLTDRSDSYVGGPFYCGGGR